MSALAFKCNGINSNLDQKDTMQKFLKENLLRDTTTIVDVRVCAQVVTWIKTTVEKFKQFRWKGEQGLFWKRHFLTFHSDQSALF